MLCASRDPLDAFSLIESRFSFDRISPVPFEAAREVVRDHLRWGLIPYWAKRAEHRPPHINAKVETITTEPAFCEAINGKDHKAGIDLLTFTVVTTSELVPERDYERWLPPGGPARPPIDLLRRCEADKMKAWNVGDAKNDAPDLLIPDNVVEMRK